MACRVNGTSVGCVGKAHLDWLSSEQDKRRLYGPAYLLGNLSVTPGGGSKIKWYSLC